ncbi:hypothetical protein OZX73_01920 [Bifidobacterium sp. ESL0775]|uniref:hypothetical protein n=1 Tax=Bifidobacterium sp. ESL0775 TaxID=2983230 RepID=UPI0023F860EA|nr:hypothetical protein [Bifidobacterium sp. ESL0775]WEV69666.1 hypothetical protein OZX73_01920 [Bifidobacterium sp. ESL0775]
MAPHNGNKPGNAGLCWLVATVLVTIVPKVSPPWATTILIGCLLLAFWKMK